MADDLRVDAPTLAEVAALLSDLVAIPSVNPAFRAEGDRPDIFGEQAKAGYLLSPGSRRPVSRPGCSRFSQTARMSWQPSKDGPVAKP
jgi:acetylornithine deacetylase/succinyl-diaminopimelate desuccinylase-like protein